MQSSHHANLRYRALLGNMTIATVVVALVVGGMPFAAAAASNSATSTSVAPKAACAVPSALPAAPSAQAQIVQFSGAWAADDKFNATLWREACPADGTTSILYFRVVQTQGVSFICGGELQVTQSGTPYDIRFVQDVSHTAFCDNLPGPTTFVIDQYPDNPQFDNNSALGFAFKGAFNNVYSVALPAFNVGNNSVTPAVGLWFNPAESGSGYALDVKHGVLVMTGYSYTSSGTPIWYLAAGPIVNSVFTATLDKYAGGQCISCSYRPTAGNGNDGVVSITFSSPTTATMTLPGGRVFPIVSQPF